MRTLRSLVALVGVAAILTACQPGWVTFRGDAAGTGVSPTARVTLVNVDSLVPAWTGSLGAATSSSAAVVDGKVFIGSDAGGLAVFDDASCGTPTTGCEPQWTGPTDGAVISSPTVAGGRVYVGSDDGHLYAFDAAGAAGCSGMPRRCAPLWVGQTGGAVRSSPRVVGEVVYVGSTDGSLYAFSTTGVGCSGQAVMCTPLWTAATGGAITSSPAVADGTVYVGSEDGMLYAFDASGAGCDEPGGCRPTWRARTGGAISGSPAVASGRVYVGSADQLLYAFEATGGTDCGFERLFCRPVWTGGAWGPVSSSPAVADGLVFVASEGGLVSAFYEHPPTVQTTSAPGCTISGSCWPLWVSTPGEAFTSSPAVAGGVIYLGSTDGRLVAFDAKGGLGCQPDVTDHLRCTPVWSASTGAPIRSSPAIAGSQIYIGSGDGLLHVFRPTESTVPIPPTVDTPNAIPGEHEVTVRWTPAVRRDLPIAGYRVQPFVDGVAGAPVEVGPEADSLTLEGLGTTSTYSFTVAVHVGDQTSPPSGRSDGEVPRDHLAGANFLVTAAHDGRASGSIGPAPKVRWTVPFEGPVSYAIVVDGRVFVTTRTDPLSAATPRVATLHAFDQATGAPLWPPIEIARRNGTSTVLVHDDHTIYVANGLGELIAVDEATGAVRWRKTVLVPIAGPPTAFRGLIYVNGGSGELRAVDGHTGRTVFRTAGGSIAVDRTGVYDATSCATVNRSDLTTGVRRWTRRGSCSGPDGPVPVLAGGRVFARVSSSPSVILDAGSGATLGSFEVDPTLAVDETTRFTVAGGRLTASDLVTGASRWSSTGGALQSNPVLVGDVVVASSASGVVRAFDRTTGAVVWTTPSGAILEGPPGSGAVTSEGGMVFVSGARQLVAIG